MSGQIEMPKYKSHKEVWALKIKSVDATMITPADAGYAPLEVSEQYIAKHDPKAGGYYVVYEDGYASFSPADAFEGGYLLATRDAVLKVWYGSMPESNGKTNWTAILHRGDIIEGVTLDRSEHPDRVRYEADRVRYLIGEIDKRPCILDYDADKHSGYVPRDAAPKYDPATQPGSPQFDGAEAYQAHLTAMYPNADDARARVAKGLEYCDWSGVPIGNKAIIQHAIDLLRATPADHIAQARDAWIEQCAKVCDDGLDQVYVNGWVDCANERKRCAAAIRALTTPSDERHDG